MGYALVCTGYQHRVPRQANYNADDDRACTNAVTHALTAREPAHAHINAIDRQQKARLLLAAVTQFVCVCVCRMCAP